MMNSFLTSLQIEDWTADDAYAEWLWRHEMATREDFDSIRGFDEANLELHSEANDDPQDEGWDEFGHTPSVEAVTMGGLFGTE
jgi:hypothetical protein